MGTENQPIVSADTIETWNRCPMIDQLYLWPTSDATRVRRFRFFFSFVISLQKRNRVPFRLYFASFREKIKWNFRFIFASKFFPFDSFRFKKISLRFVSLQNFFASVHFASRFFATIRFSSGFFRFHSFRFQIFSYRFVSLQKLSF
jgi:hypothetical protein